jgi:hypothetical protein
MNCQGLKMGKRNFDNFYFSFMDFFEKFLKSFQPKRSENFFTETFHQFFLFRKCQNVHEFIAFLALMQMVCVRQQGINCNFDQKTQFIGFCGINFIP